MANERKRAFATLVAAGLAASAALPAFAAEGKAQVVIPPPPAGKGQIVFYRTGTDRLVDAENMGPGPGALRPEEVRAAVAGMNAAPAPAPVADGAAPSAN